MYDLQAQQFKNRKDHTLQGYPLQDFIDDYYKMDLDRFRQKLEDLIGCILDQKCDQIEGPMLKRFLKLKDVLVTLNHPEVNEHLPYGRKVNSLEALEKNLKVFESVTKALQDPSRFLK